MGNRASAPEVLTPGASVQETSVPGESTTPSHHTHAVMDRVENATKKATDAATEARAATARARRGIELLGSPGTSNSMIAAAARGAEAAAKDATNAAAEAVNAAKDARAVVPNAARAANAVAARVAKPGTARGGRRKRKHRKSKNRKSTHRKRQ
jgi:hypothetical protein